MAKIDPSEFIQELSGSLNQQGRKDSSHSGLDTQMQKVLSDDQTISTKGKGWGTAEEDKSPEQKRWCDCDASYRALDASQKSALRKLMQREGNNGGVYPFWMKNCLQGDELDFHIKLLSATVPGTVEVGQSVKIASTFFVDSVEGGTADWILFIDGSEEERKRLDVDPAEELHISHRWTPQQEREYDIEIVLLSDSFEKTVSAVRNQIVPTITSTNSSVDEGEKLKVNVLFENVALQALSTDAFLDIDGVERDSDYISLSEGQTSTRTLVWETEDGDAGSYIAEIQTENARDQTSVEVSAPSTGIPAFSVSLPSPPISETSIQPIDEALFGANKVGAGTMVPETSVPVVASSIVPAPTGGGIYLGYVYLSSGSADDPRYIWVDPRAGGDISLPSGRFGILQVGSSSSTGSSLDLSALSSRSDVFFDSGSYPYAVHRIVVDGRARNNLLTEQGDVIITDASSPAGNDKQIKESFLMLQREGYSTPESPPISVDGLTAGVNDGSYSIPALNNKLPSSRSQLFADSDGIIYIPSSASGLCFALSSGEFIIWTNQRPRALSMIRQEWQSLVQ